MNKLAYCLCAGLLCLLPAGRARAANRTVTNLNDNGAGSLRSTIAASASGDTINFGVTGTITLTTGELPINVSLTISGPGSLTVSGNNASRVFNIGSAATVSISNLTIANGRRATSNGSLAQGGGIFNAGTLTLDTCNVSGNNASSTVYALGGGLYNVAKAMTLNNCILTNNHVSCDVAQKAGGGSLFNEDGVLTMQGCTVSGNSAEDFGGGLANDGTMAMSNCTISNNSAAEGAGLSHGSDPGTITGCNFSGNSATNGGGVENRSFLTVDNSTFTGNTAEYGGAYKSGPNFSSVTFTACTLSSNAADQDGGGIHNTVGSVSLTACKLSGNTAGIGGAGLWNAGTLNINNSTCNGNTSQFAGGALYNRYSATLNNTTIYGNDGGVAAGAVVNDGQNGGSANLKLTNCTVSQNTAGQGGGLYNEANAGSATLTLLATILQRGASGANLINFSGTITSLGHNLSNDNGGGFLTGPGDIISTEPLLGPLQNNGGSTPTMSLLSGSPALNTGDDAVLGAPYNLSTDQRGSGYPRKAGAHVDIGAFEQDVFQSGATLLVTTTAEHDDGACGVSDCTLLEALNASNANSDANTINFKAGLNGTIVNTLASGGLYLANPVTINGPGARALLISGNFAKRIFYVGTGVTANISGLSIAYANSGSGVSGGAIYNDGALTLLNCAVFNNQGGSGAGVVNLRGLNATNCTFSGNVSSGHGAAIRNASDTVSANAVITNCTFWGNNAFSSGAITSSGTPALPATLTLTSCTISANSAGDGAGGAGGGIFNYHDGTIAIGNTIVAGNNAVNGTDVSGAFNSQGYNLIGSNGGSTGFANGVNNDQVGYSTAQVNLGPLQNNGGPTDTLALLSGSVAFDKGKGFGLTTDQRGKPRPVDQSGFANASGGDGSDIGAFEQETIQSGATLIVNTTAEHDDGACGVTDCTLREAVNAANANGDASTINFKPGLSGAIANTLSPGGLELTNPVTINGPGARTLTISGNSLARIFYILPGCVATVSGLTIANGNSGFGVDGGAINNSGALTLLNCSVLNNRGNSGGGVASVGTMSVTNCTFAANQASDHGGAVLNTGSAAITNSTFFGNQGVSSGAITSAGTTIVSASVILTSCTISGNRATDPFGGTGGGLFNFHDGTITVRNTIVAGNNADIGPDVSGAFVSQGYNLIGIGDGGDFVDGANHDQVGNGDEVLDAHLGPLANNGGPTDTRALLFGAPGESSPAIDAGSLFGLSTDQRGQPRPADGNGDGAASADIGALEAPIALFTISGRIVDLQGTAMSGVTVTRDGNPALQAATNSAGYFTLTGVPGGLHSVVPTRTGYAFTPSGRSVTVNGTNVSGQNFTGGIARHITGRIATSSGAGLPNAALQQSGSIGVVYSNSAGYFSLTVPDGTYIVTPSLTGYAFSPVSRQVTVNGADVGGQNFLAGIARHITGRISTSTGLALPNVAVTRNGSSTAAYSNSAGYYTLTLLDGTYTVTPSLSGYGFTPSSRTVMVNGADVGSQNFVGGTGYSISGRIATSSGAAMAGVTVTRSGGATTTTNSAGYYTLNNVPNGSYIITPTQAGKTFSPATRTVVINGANSAAQNFTGQ